MLARRPCCCAPRRGYRGGSGVGVCAWLTCEMSPLPGTTPCSATTCSRPDRPRRHVAESRLRGQQRADAQGLHAADRCRELLVPDRRTARWKALRGELRPVPLSDAAISQGKLVLAPRGERLLRIASQAFLEVLVAQLASGIPGGNDRACVNARGRKPRPARGIEA
jgi:hypothetical protein